MWHTHIILLSWKWWKPDTLRWFAFQLILHTCFKQQTRASSGVLKVTGTKVARTSSESLVVLTSPRVTFLMSSPRVDCSSEDRDSRGRFQRYVDLADFTRVNSEGSVFTKFDNRQAATCHWINFWTAAAGGTVSSDGTRRNSGQSGSSRWWAFNGRWSVNTTHEHWSAVCRRTYHRNRTNGHFYITDITWFHCYTGGIWSSRSFRRSRTITDWAEGGDGNEQGQHTGEEQPISSQTEAGKRGYTCILIGSI